MNDNYFSTTDWHCWRKEKSRRVIEYLASALTCQQTPKSREMIGHAIRDAAKLFTLELQIERGGEFGEFAELTDEITNSVRRSPPQAKELLDMAVAKLIGDANNLTAQRSNPVIRET